MAESTINNQSKLSEAKFHNWIKSGLAVMYTKKGLQPFVIDEITTFQQKTFNNIITTLSLTTDTKCSACPTDVIVCDKVFENCKRKICSSYHRLCPEGGLCDQFKQYIIKAHRYHGPSWFNTNARLWCSDPWQVAKCYMPREGYSTQMTADETDFNGIVSVILNHKDFSKTLYAKLADTENIFRKARDISKLVRHSALYEVADDGFDDNLGILTKVLEEKQIAKYKEAQDAMQKLSQLKKSKWSILTSMNDIFEVIKTACTSDNAPPTTAEEEEKMKLLKIAVKVIEEKTSTDVKSVVNKLQASVEKHKLDKIKRKEICRRLIKSYQLECSSLPISALFEEEDAPLLNFYVQPLMQQVDYHRVRKHFTTIKSYHDIFHKEDKLCRNIYLTGNAGTGKTAVCQRLVLCWCHAQSEGGADEKFSAEDIGAMKLFDYLFFVSLRDTNKCHVEDMIQQQLLSSVKVEFIDQILEDENCLIVLDGLDEWSHPKLTTTLCPVEQKIPHRKVRDRCMYLTTSRPWKLESNRLKGKEIDQQIELKGLDRRASDQLTAFVINHLNSKYLNDRSSKEFQDSVENRKQVANVSEIPIIKIQLISLWFQDNDVTQNYSRCDIYANTVEMLFSRALDRAEKEPTRAYMCESVKQINAKHLEQLAPDFISKCPLLKTFLNLLSKIGRLAFDMLFCTPDDKSALVFKRNFGGKYGVSDIEMDFLLYVGILSKNKVIGPQLDRLIKLTFLHKSYQEFFAALYISLSQDTEYILKCIFGKCDSLIEFLKYEQLFVFLSGMDVKKLERISAEVCKMVSADKNVKSFRQTSHYQFELLVVLKPYHTLAGEDFERSLDGEGALRCLQKLLMNCLEEGDCVGSNPTLTIADVFIEDQYTPELKRLTGHCKDSIKSISTNVYINDLTSLTSLEKLVFNEDTYTEAYRMDIEQCGKFIATSNSNFVSLSLANCEGHFDVSTGRFKNLLSLALCDVVLKHDNLVEVFTLISKTVSLRQLYLCGIRCSDHQDKCCGSELNLSNHSQMRYLRLQKLYEHGAHETSLINENLQVLVLQDDSKGEKVMPVFQDIDNAPNLIEINLLEFKTSVSSDAIIDTLQSLPCLERITFVEVNLGNSIFRLNTKHKQSIKMVNLFHTTLTFQSFCGFIDSLPNTGVIVHMQACKVSRGGDESAPEIDMEDAVQYIQSKGTFEVTLVDKGRLDFNSLIA